MYVLLLVTFTGGITSISGYGGMPACVAAGEAAVSAIKIFNERHEPIPGALSFACIPGPDHEQRRAGL